MRVYTVSQKITCQLIFCSMSVKHQPSLIIFGMQRPEGINLKGYGFAYFT